MPVFYVHDLTNRIVTPLDRHYHVRDIQATSEVADISPVDSKGVSNDDKPGDQQQKRRSNAVNAYRDTDEATLLDESPERLVQLGKVREIMSSNIISAGTEMTLKHAWEVMSRNEVHHLAVLDGQGFLCAFVSETDLLDALAESQLPLSRVALESLCNEDVVSTGTETQLSDLGYYMLANGVDGLPVTDNGKLVGVVTSSDILKQVLLNRGVDNRA